MTDYVLFIRNCSQEEKAAIIKNSIALIYTPKNEHFGIVPLEGMALGRPVIADNSGGPKAVSYTHLTLPTTPYV